MRARSILVLIALIAAGAAFASSDDDYSRLKNLESALNRGTATVDQQIELADLYLKSERFYEASKLAGRVLTSDPSHREAMRIRDEAGRLLREHADRTIAAAEQRARQADATDADRLALADAFFEGSRYAAAAAAYERLPESIRQGDVRLRYARSLSWSGRMDDAERVYSGVLKEAANPELELEYGQLLSWMGASRLARERLQKLYEAQPTEPAAVAYANALAWSGDREAAVRVLNEYLSAHEDATEARALLAGMQESPELRLERLNRLIDLEPYNLALRIERGRLLNDAGRYGEAHRTLRFIREHSTVEIEGLAALEEDIRKRREEELARAKERRAALDLRNPASGEEKLSLARAYTAVEAYDDAVPLYESYLADHPDDVEARIQLARVLSWDRRWSESERQYKMILAQHPDRADLRLEYAQVLSYDEKYPVAIQMFSSLTDLSDNPRAHLYSDVPTRAHYNLGQIYRWYGWNEHAIAQQNRAIELDGGYVPARHELDRMRHIRPASTIDGRYSYFTDSHDFTLKRVDVEGEKWMTRRMALQAAVGRHTFEHAGVSVNANAVSGGAAYRYNDRWTLRGRVGANFYEDDIGTRPFWGAGAEWLPNIQSRVAFDYNRYDLVYDVFTMFSLSDSATPRVDFNDPIHINDFRGHYDYSSGGFWSVLGDASYGFVSDDNRRASAHGIVSFRLLKSPFVAVKADGRYLSYDFRTNRYWSPGDYKAIAGVLQVGDNFRDRLFWTAEFKAGRSFEGGRESDLRSYSARVTVPVSDTFDIVGHYGYGRSGRLESLLGGGESDFVNYWQRNWYVGIRLRQLFADEDRRGTDSYYYDTRPLGSPMGTN